MKKRASPRKCPLIKQVGEQNRSSDSSRFSEGDHESINAISIEKLLVMYLTIKSIMLLRKYLLVTESQVSKCGFHIVKKRETCYIRNVRNIVNIVKADVVGVANRMVQNWVLEDMALKVVWLWYITFLFS